MNKDGFSLVESMVSLLIMSVLIMTSMMVMTMKLKPRITSVSGGNSTPAQTAQEAITDCNNVTSSTRAASCLNAYNNSWNRTCAQAITAWMLAPSANYSLTYNGNATNANPIVAYCDMTVSPPWTPLPTYTTPGNYTVTAPAGSYTYWMQLWGAKPTGNGGTGGYISGTTINITAGTNMTLYVGGMNGQNTYATDIKINGTALSNRIIVAAGGGVPVSYSVGGCGGCNTNGGLGYTAGAAYGTVAGGNGGSSGGVYSSGCGGSDCYASGGAGGGAGYGAGGNGGASSCGCEAAGGGGGGGAGYGGGGGPGASFCSCSGSTSGSSGTSLAGGAGGWGAGNGADGASGSAAVLAYGGNGGNGYSSGGSCSGGSYNGGGSSWAPTSGTYIFSNLNFASNKTGDGAVIIKFR